MQNIKTIEGTLTPNNGKYAIIVTRWNAFVVESLVQGAVGSLKAHGVKEQDIKVIYVPGAFEIPVTAKKIASLNKFDAIIALGAVIRGGTPHFEYVAGECVKGLNNVALEYNLPVSFGVLTVDSIEQAIERAGTKAGNKGEEAAMSAFEMVSLLNNLEQQL